MDYLLLLVGLFMVYRRNYPWLFAIIILLASTYLQLPLKIEMQMMIGPEHNVADTGLLLYLVFFFNEVVHKGIYIRSPLQKSVLLFVLFLLLSGAHDLMNGVSLGDIVRYLKNWFFLSMVFLSPNITRKEVVETLKIIFWITFCCCLILVVQYFLGVVWIGYSTMYISDGVAYTRGAKPPSYAIVCAAMAILNIFQLSRNKQILTSVVFVIPILLTLKMSYLGTLFVSLVIYYISVKHLDVVRIVRYSIISVSLLVVLLTAFPIFSQRLDETINQSSILSSSKSRQEKGNFSYRIDHFAERLEYVLQDPARSIRGLGYVQERNFHQRIFKLGQSNSWGRKSQLDTGDIAWSLLIIRLGVVGMILFVYFYFKCMGMIYLQRKRTNTDLLLFSYMFASFFFMSMGNSLIANSEFFFIPLLICMTNEDSTLYLEL